MRNTVVSQIWDNFADACYFSFCKLSRQVHQTMITSTCTLWILLTDAFPRFLLPPWMIIKNTIVKLFSKFDEKDGTKFTKLLGHFVLSMPKSWM